MNEKMSDTVSLSFFFTDPAVPVGFADSCFWGFRAYGLVGLDTLYGQLTIRRSPKDMGLKKKIIRAKKLKLCIMLTFT
jgi:hypothetical protein